MDDMPEQVLGEILERITTTADKNSISLTCKRLHALDNEQRKSIRLRNEALVSLCNRFHNLEKIEISYSWLMSESGKQLDDKGLYHLSISCPLLAHVTLNCCTFITDVGLTHLASCSHLSALKLISTPRIHGVLVVGCRNLTLFHLVRCRNITSMEWLEFLGKLEAFEDLCIKKCRGIVEGRLVMLGPTWNKLKRFRYEYEKKYYGDMKVSDWTGIGDWYEQATQYDSMLDFNLANGIIVPETGNIACVLKTCKNLQKIHLDGFGVINSDIVELARNSSNLKSFSLRVRLGFYGRQIRTRLTDECLEALASNCSNLESVRLSFSDGESGRSSAFTLHGILSLVQKCPIKELALDRVYWFDDVGMEALRCAEFLEMLELTRCQNITDRGLRFVGHFPRLSVLTLSVCLRVSDYGLEPLLGSNKLKFLAVDGCPDISERGVRGAAYSVAFAF